MPDLAELTQWLEAHINYERYGPAAANSSTDDDPSRRLRHMAELMAVMGDPHRSYPVIHLTGTNGKTSTARIVSALLNANGLTTGTYTSPHLERMNERIASNGEPIDDTDLAEVLDALRLLEPMVSEPLSYFELITAAAFRYFADKPVDCAVVEVGVGGQWDATNVADGDVAVITNVGLDHMNYLGPTRADIAMQKSGIVKANSAVVTSEQDPEILKILLANARHEVAVFGSQFEVLNNEIAVGGRLLTLRTPKHTYDDVFLSLHGAHQGTNAGTALMAAEAFFGQPLPDEAVREALGSVASPGRMEIVHRQPLCLIDGAHNRAGAAALMKSLDDGFGTDANRLLVVGMLEPHDPIEMLTELHAPQCRLVIACQPEWPRAIPAETIAKAARELGATVVVVPNVATATGEALSAADEDEIVLVTGSLYVVGAARASLASSQLP